jgi:uncharacterized membrane protein YphA (DoxX/SURF4 family)
MKNNPGFQRIDKTLTRWMQTYGILFLRISIGIVFLWFGVLKFFPGLSPGEDLAIQTMKKLSFGLIPGNILIYSLAILETIIGFGLIFRIFLRITLLLLFLQMIGAFMPVFLFPGEVFLYFPYALTLEGQYIVKNLVIISAGMVIGSTVRGPVMIEPR